MQHGVVVTIHRFSESLRPGPTNNNNVLFYVLFSPRRFFFLRAEILFLFRRLSSFCRAVELARS